ncbi:MAG: NADH-ubiquinone oxidoreductase-F iron-sulfur binding region domain-containing protein [bacterium]|nr:NADH-ubiquinone oxidoreductase-F iron-sulfur binding region domain-containing protein [bacterium]
MSAITSIADLQKLAEKKSRENQAYSKIVTLCAGTGCCASGCLPVLASLRDELEAQGLAQKIKIRTTGCHGFCEQGPLMVIEPGNTFYRWIKVEDVPEIVCETLGQDKIIERLEYIDPASGKKVSCETDIPFYKAQDRSILGQNKVIDPCDINDYIANGGYSALVKVLTSMKPDGIIEEIKESGLRGRGGGGFPTGRKWEYCRAAEGSPKYVICNADEGDPGAYMDRSVLEGNPHAVIEGMLIGAFAIGAEHGYIYVRNEYPLAVKHSKIALVQAEELGLLGKNILGTDFSFDIKVARGGGAFVCGESSALMVSLEGKVGEPRPKDIHTTEKGFMDLPTNLNNVETWANVPSIINRGAAWFASKGTDKSKGTKIFALTGQIKNTGLIEVDMGITLREIIYDIGGGPFNGKKIKAVQTGGPSGGCLPEERFDLPVDFEALTEAGSMVGSGGMVVMDESACMVDVAKYFLNFLLDESCGKCVPCRVGLSRMLEIITDITEGNGTEEKLGLLKDTAETVSLASLCALGKTAPNPVLSTIRYFQAEYEAHIKENRCPAGVCRDLIHYSINEDNCNGCGACLKACPHDAISGEKKEVHRIDDDNCQKCGICKEACKFEAIIVS